MWNKEIDLGEAGSRIMVRPTAREPGTLRERDFAADIEKPAASVYRTPCEACGRGGLPARR